MRRMASGAFFGLAARCRVLSVHNVVVADDVVPTVKIRTGLRRKMTTVESRKVTPDVIGAAAALVPTLRSNARSVDQARRIVDENIDALTELGLYRMMMPRAYGGTELDLPSISKVLAELARGCVSTAWVAATGVVSTWMAGHFPDSVQEEIFATEDVRVCGSFTPLAELTPTGGGYRLTGRWPYNTGCLHAHWDMVVARVPGAEGPALKLCAVPMSDLTIEDDWHTYGLRGTGSCTTAASDIFVPQDRVIDLAQFMQGNWVEGRSNYDSPTHRIPTWPMFIILSASVPPGVARGALDLFIERVDGRPVTYTNYTDQREAASAHFAVAEAAVRADAAALMVEQLAEEAWQIAVRDENPGSRYRQRVRANSGYVTQLSREAVEIVTQGSGASSIRYDCLTQLVFRDMQALSMHAALNTDSMFESYGRVLLGLEPVTRFA